MKILTRLLKFSECAFSDGAARTIPSVYHPHSHHTITKTRLYDFDPLKPHFYIVKLGFTGVYLIFLILLKT